MLFSLHNDGGTENMNMEDDHHTVIKCLGPPFEKIYFLD